MFLISNYQALGTICNIEVFEETQPEKLNLVKSKVLDIIEEFESKYSRFIDNSYVSILNKNKKVNNFDFEFINILELSQRFERETKGIFDIKLGHFLSGNGYGRNYIDTSSYKKGYLDISTDYVKIVGNFEIDLGGIGKSYLIQKIIDILIDRFQIKYFLINFGGDIYATSNQEKEIKLHLENPLTNEIFGSVLIKNKAVCGSSPYKRKWRFKNQEYSHIVSTSNKELYSSFVFSNNIIDADVFATCLCIDSDLQINRADLGYIIFNSKGNIIKQK